MIDRKRFIVWLLLLALAGCTPAEPRNGERLGEYADEDGLSVRLKPEFSARRAPGGFVIEPADNSNRNARFPFEIRIALIKGRELPDVSALSRKTLANRSLGYRLEKSDAGSGGESFALTAYERVPGGYLEFSQTLYAEGNEPDFRAFWEIVENTSVK